MMANEYDIVIRAQDKTGRTLSKIEGQLRGIQKTGTSIGQSGAGLAGLTRFITPATVAVTALGAAFAKTAGFALESARQMENTVNQLRLVTNGQADFLKQQGRLAQLARDNRASFDSTVELFTKLKVATEELGYSTETVEELTSKMSKALVVAGADANTANGVIRQFGQAMASGVVRGDEFNSIVEGLGPALNIMARESGVTVGQLREMAGNGELTAEVFAKMLLNSNALEESFGKLAPTMDQVNTQLDDSLMRLGTAIDNFFGLSEGMKAVKTEAAELAEGLAKALEPPTEAETLLKRLQEIDKQINETKAAMLTVGVDSTADPGLMSDLGAFLNPNATQDELDRAVRRAGMGFGDTGSVNSFSSSALSAQQKALSALEQERRKIIDAMNDEANARKRNLQEMIREAEENARIELAQKAEAERIAKLDKLYSKYALTRTEAAKRYAEVLEEQAKHEARVKEIIEGADPFVQRQTKAYNENKEKIATLNRELKTNNDLSMGQRRQIRGIIDDLTKQNYIIGDNVKMGELQYSVYGKYNEALAENKKKQQDVNKILKQLNPENQRHNAIKKALIPVLQELVEEEGKLNRILNGQKDEVDELAKAYSSLMREVNGSLKSQQTDLQLAQKIEEEFKAGRMSLDAYAEARSKLGIQAPITPAISLAQAKTRIDEAASEKKANDALVQSLLKLGYTRDQIASIGLIDLDKRKTATQQITERILEEDKSLANLKASLANVNQLSKDTGISVEELTKALTDQINSIESRNNIGMQLGLRLQEEQRQFQELTDLLADRKAIEDLAKRYGVSSSKIISHLRKQRKGFTDLYEANLTLKDIATDSFEEMGKSLASNLTKALMDGKKGFESFKDYLKSWAKSLISTVIEKMLMQPMIDQLTNWMGLTNKIVPTLAGQLSGIGGGGAGAGMAGGAISAMLKPVQGPNLPGAGGGFWSGLGNWFSGAWSGITNWASGLWSGVSNWFSNIFSGFFADGGYIPAGKVGIAGEAGMELISGPANVTPMEDIGGGGALTVNFNINAIDPGTGTEFILEHRTEIEGIIQNAYNKRGREGIYG